MNQGQKFWNWLSGKKTVIASAYWTLYAMTEVIYPEILQDPVVKNITHRIGLALGVLGLGHKAVKKSLASK